MKELAGASKKEVGGGLDPDGFEEGKKEEAVEKSGFDVEVEEEEGGVGRGC